VRVGAGTTSDAIVVGAGIVGAACAEALARDGWRVTILEETFAASGTTAAGMGHIVVMDDSPEQLALTAYSDRLWRELGLDSDRRSEVERCGTLWIAEDSPQLAALEAKREAYAAVGVATEVLDARGLEIAEPTLRRGLAGALRVPADSVVYPPGATLELLRRAKSRGAVLREGVRVTALDSGFVRTQAGDTMRADVVVNAAGARAAQLTPELPIVPRKGHLAITDRTSHVCRHQLVELGYLASAHSMTTESVAFNLQPRSTGQMLIGSSRELVGWDASINRAVLGRMLARAVEFVPSLANQSVIRCWTGFRPATPDKLPLIGAWGPTPGLWVAAGHEGLGITTSLATAAILADLVAGRVPAIDAASFAPTRAMAGLDHELKVPA
jgi:glycine/D-amino acid oxidase-like deaminating enzyme